jgi:hypothetical protein
MEHRNGLTETPLEMLAVARAKYVQALAANQELDTVVDELQRWLVISELMSAQSLVLRTLGYPDDYDGVRDALAVLKAANQ